MDDNWAIGTEFREVREVERGGEPAHTVVGARTYAAEIEELWDALTNAERIPRWFLPIEGDLRPGGRYQFQGNAGGAIEHCEPPSAVELTWEFGENVSWVRLSLEPDGEGTRLTLTHTILKDEAGEQHWSTYGPGATGVGWDLSFFGLGLYLGGEGAALDAEAIERWLATEPGKVLIRGCAKAWGAAHVEAGEASEVAEEMAARTSAFYAPE